METVHKLEFSLQAYRKIMLANGYSQNEVSFYGITNKTDGLKVIDVFMPVQTVSGASCEMDDTSVSEYCHNYAKKGYWPRQLTRIWIHTHPSGLLTPSVTDEKTFNDILGVSNLAVMVIVEKGGSIVAWLQLNNIKGLQGPVRVKLLTSINYMTDCGFKEKRFKRLFTERVKERVYTPVTASNYGMYGGDNTNNRWGFQRNQRVLAANAGFKEHDKDDFAFNDFCDICKQPLKDESDFSLCDYCGEPIERCVKCSAIDRVNGEAVLCMDCDGEENIYNEHMKEEREMGQYDD